MINILKLAFKNLLRHKKRTIITSSSIALGLAILIWIDGMLKWCDNETQRNLKKFEYGNFIVSTKDFSEKRKDYPVDSVITKNEIETIFEIAKKLNCLISLRTGFKSIVSFNRGFGLPYLVYAIDPEMDSKIFPIHKYIIEGKYLSETEENEILISKNCKKEFNLNLGDYLLIETRTKYNTYQGLYLKVIGIFDVPDPVVNRNQLFISRKTANQNLQLEDQTTEIVFKTPDGKNEPYLGLLKKFLIEKNLKNLVVKNWQELAEDYFTLSQTKKGGTSIIMFFIFIIVAIGITNTMLMAAFERIREIGTLRALGLKENEVLLSFILEATGIGVLGGIFGLFLGIILNIYSIYFGIDFTSILKDMDYGYRVSTVIYNEWNPETMITGFLFCLIYSALISIIPARKAIKIEITEALRYV